MDKYIYILNYKEEEESLCNLEMKSIFNVLIKNKMIISNIKIDPSKSPYIKERITYTYEANSVEELELNLKMEGLSIEDFKVNFIKTFKNKIDYEDRLKIIKKLGMCINGEAEIYNPEIEFGVLNIGDKWIFGEHMKHNNDWNIHDKKPCTYSTGLNFRLARSLINIAVGGDKDPSIIDPCCGIGTVVLEGLSLGYNIKGYEVNTLIGERAKANLKFFDYEDVIQIVDMHLTTNKFDVSIVDIPYGLFNPITKSEQENIIKTSRKISKKMVIITHEELDKMIKESGFKILNKCCINKGKFKRYITVCS